MVNSVGAGVAHFDGNAGAFREGAFRSALGLQGGDRAATPHPSSRSRYGHRPHARGAPPACSCDAVAGANLKPGLTRRPRWNCCRSWRFWRRHAALLSHRHLSPLRSSRTLERDTPFCGHRDQGRLSRRLHREGSALDSCCLEQIRPQFVARDFADPRDGRYMLVWYAIPLLNGLPLDADLIGELRNAARRLNGAVEGMACWCLSHGRWFCHVASPTSISFLQCRILLAHNQSPAYRPRLQWRMTRCLKPRGTLR